ncbi:MAG: protein-export chaperone SecB [Pseudomonadota bacterium]
MVENKENLQEQAEAQFAIHKVYVKDVSFETPNSPDVFKLEWKPEVDMHLTNNATPVGDHLFDVVLSLTLTVKLGDTVAYLVEVNQAGVFFIKDIPDEVIDRMLATVCANILFPFARETVSDIVTRGGFPQLLLAPVNFDAMYIQQQQADQQSGSGTTH